MRNILIFFVLVTSILRAQVPVDLIVFSYHRPMQLYAMLESLELNIKDKPSVFIIYRSDLINFDKGYEIVKKRFPEYQFIKEVSNGVGSLTLKCLSQSSNQYLLFSTDDIIVTQPIDLNHDIRYLVGDVFGVFYRNGLNIKCQGYPYYGLRKPRFTSLKGNLLLWSFKNNDNTWNYPFNLDFTLYKKKDVEKRLKDYSFLNPTALEGEFYAGGYTKSISAHGQGICYKNSKIVNIANNRVTTNGTCYYYGKQTIGVLNRLFLAGLKIDIGKFQNSHPVCTHLYMNYSFIKRG